MAVVTGGSGAIGKAISLALVREGATVVMAGRRVGALEAAADEILAQVSKGGDYDKMPAQVRCAALDVTCEGQVEHFFRGVVQDHGRCDLLVNNAGTAAGGDVTDIDAATFSKVMDVNVLGPFLCSREA